MFRKLASLLVLAMLAAPVLAHAEDNYAQDRTVASAKHKKKKAKSGKAHAKKKKKSGHAAAAKKARATRAKKGTHAPSKDVMGEPGSVNHTPPMDAGAKDDLPPPSTDGAAPEAH